MYFLSTDYTDGHEFFLTRIFRIARILGALLAPAMRDVLLISHRRLRRQQSVKSAQSAPSFRRNLFNVNSTKTTNN